MLNILYKPNEYTIVDILQTPLKGSSLPKQISEYTKPFTKARQALNCELFSNSFKSLAYPNE
jgi:hypothetical protein